MQRIRYLQGTHDFLHIYKRTDNLEVIGYFDSDFVGYTDTRKSTSDYISMLACKVYLGATKRKHWIQFLL